MDSGITTRVDFAAGISSRFDASSPIVTQVILVSQLGADFGANSQIDLEDQ